MDKFERIMCILDQLAQSPTGLTAGMVAKRCSQIGCNLSRSQAERSLKELGKGGWVRLEKRAYRSNMNSTYYHITEHAVLACASVATEYSYIEKQLVLTGV